MSVPVIDEDDAYLGVHHVYEPYRAGLPKLKPYARELWRRREFALEMSRSGIRAAQSNTVIGQLWNVLNPLLLGAVYYLLVIILGGSKPPAYFPYLLGGLFLFYFIAGSMTGGASSVISAGKLVMNTAFPRILLPLSAVRTAFFRFLPTMIVFYAAYLVAGLRPNPVQLLAIPWFALVMLFATGLAMMLATFQVYFRDTSSFLPYVTRIWLYASPVLWVPEVIPEKFKAFEVFNPLFALCGGWGDILIEGKVPTVGTWGVSIGWSLTSLILGAFMFLTRERDFAVRI